MAQLTLKIRELQAQSKRASWVLSISLLVKAQFKTLKSKPPRAEMSQHLWLTHQLSRLKSRRILKGLTQRRPVSSLSMQSLPSSKKRRSLASIAVDKDSNLTTTTKLEEITQVLRQTQILMPQALLQE